jgi:class 3 adenylate cyclase
MSVTNASETTGGTPDRRKLIVVLYADMVGYSRLIGLDDAGTLARLRTLRSILIDPAIEEHGVGDAIADGTDLHGDGVNVAARLQAECPPGGICVSRSVPSSYCCFSWPAAALRIGGSVRASSNRRTASRSSCFR